MEYSCPYPNASDNGMGEEDLERLLQSLADEVIRRRMAPVAVFLLELHKPIASLLHTGMIVSMPVLVPLFGVRRVQQAGQLLRSRSNFERLIQLIEEREHNDSGPS